MSTPPRVSSVDKSPRVTVYIPCQSYGRYLSQAIESVVAQTLTDWELFIIDDGSADDTAQVAEAFRERHEGRIQVLRNQNPKGLRSAANAALELTCAPYIMRLDADDYLDENALRILVDYLDRHPEAALVYPNYVYVNEQGRYLAVEQRKQVGSEVELMDLPAHGACTMIRTRVLRELGGYDQQYDRQDGYELWLKVIDRYPVGSVATPLFYYRQHSQSLTRDSETLHSVRAQIKRDRVESRGDRSRLRVAAVIAAKNTYEHMPNLVLADLAGQKLIDYTLSAGFEAAVFDDIVVTTDDVAVADHCDQFDRVLSRVRGPDLDDPHVSMSAVVNDAVSFLERELSTTVDVIVYLSVHSPLRRAEHIRMALDTLILYNPDSVISVCEDYELHYSHGAAGLEILNPSMYRRIRTEREALYVNNGAIHALWRDTLGEENLLGRSVGHVLMSGLDGLQIKAATDAWLIQRVLDSRNSGEPLVPESWMSRLES